MFDLLIRLGLVALLTLGAYWLTRYLLTRLALPFLRRSRPKWATPVESSRLPRLMALLTATITMGLAASLLTTNYAEIAHILVLLDTVVGIGVFAFVLTTTASIGLNLYEQQPLAKEVPLSGFVQLVQGGIYLIGALMIVATFLGVPAIYSLTALVAIFTALGFVFQDPIMGFVAGIQLAANKMVAIGDWIEVPQYGANGSVLEILMSSVKVRNWDNTVTTVPTRMLISDSFKNWRPMTAAGGRRLQRSVQLDVYSVRAMTPELLEQFPNLASVWRAITSGQLAADDILVGDALAKPTNLGVYRVYLTQYLRQHPRVNQEMLRMVHQLPAAENGVPLELYAFLTDTGWPLFEMVASSIFEHVFATLPHFGLRLYQRPFSIEIGALPGDPGQLSREKAEILDGVLQVPPGVDT